MAQGTLNLHIGSSFSGEGFAKLKTALAASGQQAARASEAVGAVSAATGGLGRNVQQLLGLGRMLTKGLLSTGVWAAAAWAVSAMIGKVKELADALKQVHERSSFAERTKTNDGYNRRVARYGQEDRERAAEEKRLEAEAAAKRRQYDAEQQIKWHAYAQDRLTKEREITAEQERRNLIGKEGLELARSEAQIRIRDAQRQTAAAQNAYSQQSRYGTAVGKEQAWDALRLAQEREKTVIEQERAKIITLIKAREAEELAIERAAAEAEEEAELRAKINRVREKIAKDEKDAADKAAKIDAEIEQKKKDAAEWQVKAAGAQGKSFGEWEREQKRAAKDRANEEAKSNKQFKAAKDEYERIWARTHDRNGNLLKSASKTDLERMRKLNEFGALRNAENDPMKKVEQLEKEKRDLLQRTAAAVEKTEAALKNLGL